MNHRNLIAFGDVEPAGVGYDIACGNCAVQTPLEAADLDVARVMDEIWRTISFGMGRNNDERISDHEVFDKIANSPVKEQRKLLSLARGQLGTVGGGNHYVDLFADRADGSLSTTRMRVAIGWSIGCSGSCRPTPRNASTIITTSRGGKRTAAAARSSCATARRRHSQAKQGSSVDRWATIR